MLVLIMVGATFLAAIYVAWLTERVRAETREALDHLGKVSAELSTLTVRVDDVAIRVRLLASQLSAERSRIAEIAAMDEEAGDE